VYIDEQGSKAFGMMGLMFLWHHALWLMLLPPALAGVYLALVHRKHQAVLRHASLGLIRAAVGGTQQIRPHIAPLILLLGLSALLLGVARPVFVTTSPSTQGTVILLMDVSLSMAATDVPPTRLAAARAAALAFVQAQPPDVKVGVIAFGGHADLVQPPTADRTQAMAALERLELQRYTAIGTGLVAALLTIFPTADLAHGVEIFGMGPDPRGTFVAASNQPLQPQATHKPVAPGSYLSAAVILVSDGVGTMGVPVVAAAKMAADLGIRVFTVGVGTLYGGVANTDGWPTIHAEFSEKNLKEIARITKAEYFEAQTAHKLATIYQSLGKRVVIERKEYEITALLVGLGLVLSLAAALLSLLWSSRIR
jgi:Ca-activated chloride channel family protein